MSNLFVFMALFWGSQVVSQQFFPDPVCLAPGGIFGKCVEASNCSTHVPSNNIFMQNVCYTNTFKQGVCCPQSHNLFDVFTPAQPFFQPFPQFTYPYPITNTIQGHVSQGHINQGHPNQVQVNQGYTDQGHTTQAVPIATPAPQQVTNSIDPQDTNEKFQENNKLELVSPKIEDRHIEASDCGISGSISNRIYGGIEALSGQWAWMVAIFIKNYPENVFVCGGTLISAKHVLTAAHCTQDDEGDIYSPTQMLARIGNLDLMDEEGAHLIPIKEIRKNRDYSKYFNDIAILVLKKPVKKAANIAPICLPGDNFNGEKYKNALSLVAGWGAQSESLESSRILKYAAVPIWSNNECNASYSNTAIKVISDSMLCAGFRMGGVDTCQGDSGGPLMVDVNSRWTQIGIASTGYGCGEAGYPGIYTYVPKFTKWIQDHTKD